MYNDAIKNAILTDLERKKLNVVETAIVLASQGYIVNKNKYIKLDWSSILLHSFENMDLFTKAQQTNIESIYNKLSEI